MARDQIPAMPIIEMFGAYRSTSCNLYHFIVFLMVVYREICMAAAFCDGGSGQQAPTKPASKQLGSRQQVTSKPGSQQQGRAGLGSKQEVASTAALRPEVLRKRALDALPASVLTVSEQINQHAGDPNFMTSLARGLAVIQVFSERQRELTVSQISAKTGFSRAAVRRCLYTLAKLGFAASDDSRHFHLRPRVLALGHSYISSMPLAAMAQPILENVSHILHESCSIATLDRTDIVYIARANVTRIMSIDLV